MLPPLAEHERAAKMKGEKYLALILGMLLSLAGGVLALMSMDGYRQGQKLYERTAASLTAVVTESEDRLRERGEGNGIGADHSGDIGAGGGSYVSALGSVAADGTLAAGKPEGNVDPGEGAEDGIKEKDAGEKDTDGENGRKSAHLELPADAPPRLCIEWEELRESMPDAVAWLFLPSVSISYPVMQGEDNCFYLHHAGNGEELFAGSVFLDARNSPDFSDDNSVLYAHNMRDKSMFGRLKEIPEKVREEQVFFWLFTPARDHLCRVFSCRKAEAGDPAYTLRLPEEDRAFWISELLERAERSPGALPDLGSRIVTLSTCTEDSEIRLIVQGVEVFCREREE